jgi:hypothetical protein
MVKRCLGDGYYFSFLLFPCAAGLPWGCKEGIHEEMGRFVLTLQSRLARFGHGLSRIAVLLLEFLEMGNGRSWAIFLHAASG